MLEINKLAPRFSLFDESGQLFGNEVFAKNPFTLIFFYAEDDTEVCNKQHFSIRAGIEEFTRRGIALIGVSPDEPARHVAFKKKESLPYMLASDPDKKMMVDWGAWGEKNMYGHTVVGILRRSYLIDDKGMIRAVIAKAQTKTFTEQVVKVFDSLFEEVDAGFPGAEAQ